MRKQVKELAAVISFMYFLLILYFARVSHQIKHLIHRSCCLLLVSGNQASS